MSARPNPPAVVKVRLSGALPDIEVVAAILTAAGAQVIDQSAP